jgi:hypothetical protein
LKKGLGVEFAHLHNWPFAEVEIGAAKLTLGGLKFIITAYAAHREQPIRKDCP